MDRRQFLRGGAVLGAVGAVGASGVVAGAAVTHQRGSSPVSRGAAGDAAVAAGWPRAIAYPGREQPGITRPGPPQRYLQLSSWRLAEPGNTRELVRLLDDLGRLAVALGDGSHPAMVAFPPAALTMTVGLGPGPAATLMPAAARVDLAPLPRFARDELTAATTGGDLVVQLCAHDPAVLAASAAALGTALRGPAWLAWAQAATRGEARANGSTRNALGFLDGVVAPRTDSELEASVWISSGTGPRSTIMVARRMRVDLAGFHGRTPGVQEHIIGRRRDSGAPLSGGRADDNIDPGAKAANGDYLVAIDAHARRADPRPAGLPLMLRRSYSYDNGPADQGLLFISFQNRLRTFVRTQQRMDERDALNALTRTTASGAFLLLPGVPADAAGLGSALVR
jgi:dye decolorizing peroxidase